MAYKAGSSNPLDRAILDAIRETAWDEHEQISEVMREAFLARLPENWREVVASVPPWQPARFPQWKPNAASYGISIVDPEWPERQILPTENAEAWEEGEILNAIKVLAREEHTEPALFVREALLARLPEKALSSVAKRSDEGYADIRRVAEAYAERARERARVRAAKGDPKESI